MRRSNLEPPTVDRVISAVRRADNAPEAPPLASKELSAGRLDRKPGSPSLLRSEHLWISFFGFALLAAIAVVS